MNSKFPTEVYLPWLDITIQAHWEYHAVLMMFVWFVLVPAGIAAVRFFKTEPRPYGIEKTSIGAFHPKLLCWTLHFIFLYAAIGLAIGGLVVAVLANGGYSGSMHAVWGIATVAFGCLQLVSAWLRGTHGGKYGAESDPDKPETWHGDHFDMTPRRLWFEAYHKTGGYFTLFLAVGAVTSGLMKLWMPGLAIALGLGLLAVFVLYVVLEGKGLRHDTYHSVYGTHPDLPYNKRRAAP